jgi:HEAT repeat protein
MRITRVVFAAALAAGVSGPVRAGNAAPTTKGKPEAGAKAGAAAKPDAAAKGKGPANDKGKPGPAPAATALIGGDIDAAAKNAAELADSAAPAAHDALLDALSTGLHPKVAAIALAGLARHPAPADLTVLLIYAGHRNDDVRAAAVAALGAYPDPASRKAAVAALGDDVGKVRIAAADAIARGKFREGVERLLALLDKGDAAAPPALAALADADLAHAIGEHLGTAPAGALAQTLGAILKRSDFPEPARVQVVRAIAKIPGGEATAALTDYVESTPEKPPRPSRKEAESVVESRLAGGGGQ